MDAGPVRRTVPPGKNDDSVSPYLRRPLRKYEDVTHGTADRLEEPDPEKDDAGSGESSKSDAPSKRDDRT